MGLFSSSPHFDSMDALFLDQLQDMYDAEHQITKALPKMESAATNPELKAAFRQHLDETNRQIKRLEQVFDQIGQKAKRKTCEAMKGLVAEGEQIVNASGDGDVRDAALIVAAQRVEHYEIAGYGSARTFARMLGHNQAVQLLQQNLDEEGTTDKKLTALAESNINIKAQAGAMAR